MNVVIFGHVCIDHNISNRTEYTSAGSAAMFMEKVFRHLSGVSASIVSHYGSDFLPYLEGIQIYPQQPQGEQTLVYHNDTRTHPRIWKAFLRENSPLVKLDHDLAVRIGSADVIIFAPLLPNLRVSYIQTVLMSANEHALKIILPQGYLRDFDTQDTVVVREFKEAHAVLSLMDFAILSSDDYPNVEEVSVGWAGSTGVTVVVTNGQEGATVVSEQGQVVVPGKPIPEAMVVDSVGAGDIFAACFIHRYFHSRDIEDSIAFANRLAGNSLFFTPDNLEFAMHI